MTIVQSVLPQPVETPSLEEAEVVLPFSGIAQLKEAFSSLSKQEQEKGGELFAFWCDLLTSSAV